MGVRVSAKRIMRLMTSHGLVPLFKSAKRYSSYKGELTKAPKNLVNRDFHAERPNMLWVTDLTEFSIPAGQADQDGVRHEHHGPSTRARSCGMIGGDGINDESNKTAPPPIA